MYTIFWAKLLNLHNFSDSQRWYEPLLDNLVLGQETRPVLQKGEVALA
jgi:hypothetical protein